MSDVRLVDTPHGPARVIHHRARRPWLTLVLGHGAGGGEGSTPAELELLAKRLPGQMINVVLIEQPWRLAGRRVAPSPAILDECWVAAVGALRVRTPIVVGGRSAGARVACRTAAVLAASGVVALAFPLHPPGRPEKTRLPELAACAVPSLVIQGERDPFGTPWEFPPVPSARGQRVAGSALVGIPDADHAFRVRRDAAVTGEEALDLVVEAVLEWSTRFAR